MIRIKSIFLVTLVLSLFGLTACGDSGPRKPSAWGENGHCYYVQDPHEVDYLYDDGRCPRSWTPVLMPVYWHNAYAGYYASPNYYNRYVPPTVRNTYINNQKTYISQHKTEIKKAKPVKVPKTNKPAPAKKNNNYVPKPSKPKVTVPKTTRK